MKKANSIEQEIDDIQRAFSSTFPAKSPEAIAESDYKYVMETFDNHLIVSFKNKYYRVDYEQKEDEFEFAPETEWIEVEQKKEYLEKKSISRMKANSLKAISKNDDELRVGNYIALFGGRDLEWVRSGKNADGSMGEFFTPATNFESSYTDTGRIYVDWEHGIGKHLDGDTAPGANDVLGYVDWKSAKADDRGIWVERILNRRNDYMQFLEVLIDEGLVSNSSEAITEDIETKANGEISKWPLYRDALTVQPVEPRMMTANTVTALKALAEVNPNLKTLLEAGSTSDDVVDDDEPKHDLMKVKAKAFLMTFEE